MMIWIFKALATCLLLLFLLGLGALGLCGTMVLGLGNHKAMTVPLMVLTAGVAIWWVVRAIGYLWSSPSETPADSPSDDV